jgi:signal peptidase I
VTATESAAPPRRKRRLGLWIGLGAGVLVLLGVAALIVVVSAAGFLSGHKSYQVSSTNMSPALKPGDKVIATVVSGGHYAPKRGDIVVFTAPPSWSTAGDRPGKRLSRVIAVPGDTISCAGSGQPPVIDGKSLDEPYARGGCGEAPYHLKIPAGRLWLLGDNRANSYDSEVVYLTTRDASKATVPASAVVGVVDEH